MLCGKRLSRCLLAAFLPLLASWNLPGQSIKLPANADTSASSRQDDPQARARWFLRGRTVNGQPGTPQLRDAYERKLKQRQQAALSAGALTSQAAQGVPSPFSPAGGPGFGPATPPPSNGVAWVQIGTGGTTTVSGTSNQDYGIAAGRATAVVVDQSDPTGNTVYLGGATGGLWRSTNATASASLSCLSGGICWTQLIDEQATLAVGAVAVQPGNSNVVLVGTGEANNSADSYYGLGLLRSTNALGASPAWTLIEQATVNGASQPLHGLGFTRIAFSLDNPNLVVAAAAASSEALQVGAETGGSSLRGLYYSADAGANWTYATVTDSGLPVAPGSVTAVIYNSVRHLFYAAYRYHGIYFSADGVAWTRLPNQPGGSTLNLNSLCPASPFSTACPFYRGELAITPNTDGSWRDEMYTWIVDSGDANQGIYMTTDGGQTWAAISTAGIDNCGDPGGCGTQQGIYNLALAAEPDGQASDLYAGAVNQYKCRLTVTVSGGKPDPATCSFLNLTHAYGCSNPIAPMHVHPDFHAIDFPRANPQLMFFANDGGVYRAPNSFAAYDGSCSNLPSPPWFDNLNANLGSMLQFVSFSQDPVDPSTLLGGTQDNGSPAISAAAPSLGNWIAVNNGDGGFNQINPASPSEWFTTNTYLPILRCTAGINCTASGNYPFVPDVTQTMVGGDHSSFYTPYKLDPQASTRILVGTCRVWRGNSDGSGSEWATTGTLGSPLSYAFDNTAGACALSSQMISALDAGGSCNGPACSSPALPSGGGSQVVWAGTEGTPADPANGITGSGGELWVTTNADGGPSTWQRVDGGNLGLGNCTSTPAACNINPKFYNISDVVLDRSDATGRTAYVAVMGFGAAHLLKTTDAGATWAKLDGDPQNGGLPDAPANAVALDPNTAGVVYVGTDVGVFTTSDNGASWTELGASSGQGVLPNVPVTRLRVFNSSGSVRLRASTYGRGVWDTPLASNTAADFSIAVVPQVQTVFPQAEVPGAAAIFNGTLSLFNNYAYQITLVCVPGSTSPPQTCAANPGVITTPHDGQTFTVTAANPTVGDFNFKIQAGGSDPQNLVRSQTVVLHVADFTLGLSPTTLTVPQGSTGSVQLTITPQPVGILTGTINLACGSLPAGVTCSFPSGTQVSAATISSVPLQLAVAAGVGVGNYPVAISGSYTMPGTSDTLTQTQVLTLTVTVPPLFGISGYLTPTDQIATKSFTGQVQVVPGGFSGIVNLSCDSDGLGACTLSPSAVSLSTATVTADITVATTAAMSGTHHPTVAGSGGGMSHSVQFQVTVKNYSLVASPALVVAPPGSNAAASVQLTPLSGYAGKVSLKCTPSAQVAFICNLDPGPFDLASAVATTASVWVPSGTGIAGNYPIALAAVDADLLTQTASFMVNVQDYKLEASPGFATVTAGKSSTHTLTVTGLGGFGGPVTFNAGSCLGLPALATCSFSPATVNATADGATATLTIATTAPTLTQVASRGRTRGGPFYALWLPLAGLILGLARRRPRRWSLRHWIGLCVLVAALALQISCGSGAGSGLTAPPPTPTPGTPGGTYSITVTGNGTIGASTLQRSASITLTVQ